MQPGIYCSDTLYLPSEDRNVVTQALDEKAPCVNFVYACTHGRESVKIWTSCLLSVMYGAQWFIAEAMARASTSRGNHLIWCGFNLAEKKPPIFILPGSNSGNIQDCSNTTVLYSTMVSYGQLVTWLRNGDAMKSLKSRLSFIKRSKQ